MNAAPFTPKTMELVRNRNGGRARWFVQYIWGVRARFRFALWNPLRNPLVTWQKGDPMCRYHFVSRSEEQSLRGPLLRLAGPLGQTLVAAPGMPP